MAIKPYGSVGAYTLRIPDGDGKLIVEELLSSYREKVKDLLPMPLPSETWAAYLVRVAEAAQKVLDRIQAWAFIPDKNHGKVKVELYSAGYLTGKSRVVAEVLVQSRGFKVH